MSLKPTWEELMQGRTLSTPTLWLRSLRSFGDERFECQDETAKTVGRSTRRNHSLRALAAILVVFGFVIGGIYLALQLQQENAGLAALALMACAATGALFVLAPVRDIRVELTGASSSELRLVPHRALLQVRRPTYSVYRNQRLSNERVSVAGGLLPTTQDWRWFVGSPDKVKMSLRLHPLAEHSGPGLVFAPPGMLPVALLISEEEPRACFSLVKGDVSVCPLDGRAIGVEDAELLALATLLRTTVWSGSTLRT